MRKGVRPGGPVDGILEDTRDSAVVFGGGDDEPVALLQEVLETQRPGGKSSGRGILEIAVVKWDREFPKINEFDISTGLVIF